MPNRYKKTKKVKDNLFSIVVVIYIQYGASNQTRKCRQLYPGLCPSRCSILLVILTRARKKGSILSFYRVLLMAQAA
jgi:hypothetical protein